MNSLPAFDITTHDAPAKADLQLVDQGLGVANDAAAPLHQVQPLACFARAHSGAVLGGAVGRTWGECAELQQLWVDPPNRGQGLGMQLVRRFEQQAMARGSRRCYLVTFSFQAPEFYRRLGYEVRLAITGFAPGIAKFTLLRELEPGPPAR